MDLGTTSVNILSDGTYLVDGGSMFGQIPKSIWESRIRPDRKNRIRMAMNCMIIQTGSMNILVDTGAGPKRLDKLKEHFGLNGNKLMRELKRVKLTPRDIDVVVLTHLHFDHSGGCTKRDRSGNLLLTFPKAKYLVQQADWEEAMQPNERNTGYYHPDDFLPLEEKSALTLLNGDHEITKGVTTKVTSGHSDGHQIVLVEGGSERIAFAGDLIPTPHHLPLPYIAALDSSPTHTLAEKRSLVTMAVDEGWLLVFGHAYNQRAGYIQNRNGKMQLLPVEM